MNAFVFGADKTFYCHLYYIGANVVRVFGAFISHRLVAVVIFVFVIFIVIDIY